MGPLARQELKLKLDPAILGDHETSSVKSSGSSEANSNAKNLSGLASRWLALATRSSGREAESMRLHALELNEMAAESARGSVKLSIQREIDEIRDTLSRFTLDSPRLSTMAPWTL